MDLPFENRTGIRRVDTLDLQGLVSLHDESVDPPVPFLVECFGDSYLCVHNSLYGQLRRLFLSFQGQYSLSANDLQDLIPLVAIGQIMESGVVPVRQTARPIQQIAREQPTLRASIVRFLRKNYLLRESALCVAHRILSRCAKKYTLPMNTRMYVIAHLLCQAFASTVEVVAATSIDSVGHELLFAANSAVDPRRVRAVAESVAKVGIEKIFVIGMIGFLRLSLNSQWQEKDIQRLAGAWLDAGYAASGEDKAVLGCLLTEAFTTNGDVTGDATWHYFQYMNCAEEYTLLCLPGGTEWLAKAPFIFEGINELIGLTLGGLDKSTLSGGAIASDTAHVSVD